MENIFDLIATVRGEEGKKEGCRLGIRINVRGFETICPLTPFCESYKAFEVEIQNLTKGLEQILAEARRLFEKPEPGQMFGIEPHMKAEEVWSILSRIADDSLFVAVFNKLDEAKRKEVADHVLTKCNVFSGKASLFSSRYNDGTVLLE
jgi:hypothetical protein